MKCLDTYALVEIHNGNPSYSNYLDEDIVITDITMAEFYGLLYRQYDKKTADFWHKKLSHLCRAVSRQCLIEAVVFRIENKAKNLSFFDCVGYTYSIINNMKFVTGDNQFEGMKAVEFVK